MHIYRKDRTEYIIKRKKLTQYRDTWLHTKQQERHTPINKERKTLAQERHTYIKNEKTTDVNN